MVGLVGGLGPESTIDYYRRIIQLWQQQDRTSYPPILIDSLDVNRGIHLTETDHAALTEYLLESLHRLANAGCSFAAMAANTPHIVFDDVAAKSPLPLLSIVEVCAQEAQSRGFRRVAVLGTGFTMGGRFYPDTFRRFGIEVIVPNETERGWLHERYIGELLVGIFRDEARSGVVAMTKRMRDEEQIEAVVLAGTELPLLINANTLAGLPLLDTTELHVRAIVHRLREL